MSVVVYIDLKKNFKNYIINIAIMIKHIPYIKTRPTNENHGQTSVITSGRIDCRRTHKEPFFP